MTLGNPNIFEVFARFILFSPFSNNTTIRSLFLLLNKADLNNMGPYVKRTHVQFLIWYILRLSLVYIPYSEIITQCSTILNGSDSNIISASVTFTDDPKRPPVEIADLLNLWFVSLRRRTGSSTLVLGENGQLTNLKNAISFWNSENQKAQFKPSNQMKLRVLINSHGVTEKVELKFDSDFKLIVENKDRDIKIKNKQVISLQDSEELLSFPEFSSLISQFELLDWILSKLAGIGSDVSRLSEVQEEMGKMVKEEGFLNFTANVFFNQDKSEVARVGMVRAKPSSIKPPMEDVNKLDAVLDFPKKVAFGKETPSLKDYQRLTNEITIREIFAEAQEAVLNELVKRIVPASNGFKYRQDSLSVFKLTMDSVASVSVNGSILKPEYYDMSLKKISYIFKNVAAFEIAFNYESSQLPRIYNHMAKDLYNLEGIDLLDNPFVPCQIVAQDHMFSEVLYEGDKGNSSRNSSAQEDTQQ
jgi:hypothetical protein